MVCEADICKRLLAGRMDLPASNSFLRINPLMEPHIWRKIDLRRLMGTASHPMGRQIDLHLQMVRA
jgi:hypothetical protein